jgi:hypothetical protein
MSWRQCPNNRNRVYLSKTAEVFWGQLSQRSFIVTCAKCLDLVFEFISLHEISLLKVTIKSMCTFVNNKYWKIQFMYLNAVLSALCTYSFHHCAILLNLALVWYSSKHPKIPKLMSHFLCFVIILLFPHARQIQQFVILAEDIGHCCHVTYSRQYSLVDRARGWSLRHCRQGGPLAACFSPGIV